jgi:hypothetical protein
MTTAPDEAVTFEFDGHTYTHRFGHVTVRQAVVIKERTKDELHPAGRSVMQWLDGIQEMDPMSLACLLWVIKGDAGEVCDPTTLDFDMLDFMFAIGLRMKEGQPEADADPTTAEVEPV